MDIRLAKKEDFDQIYELVKTAFETAQVSDGKEQDFVRKLRAGDTYLPELEFIAEEQGSIIGHVMMTKQTVETGRGAYTGVLVAPLCVASRHRDLGIGQKLMRYACKQAVKAGYEAAFLVGNPKYYSRFGFRETREFGIENGTEIPDEVVMACELVEGALEGIKGRIVNMA